MVSTGTYTVAVSFKAEEWVPEREHLLSCLTDRNLLIFGCSSDQETGFEILRCGRPH
jgi:hypothetical protein